MTGEFDYLLRVVVADMADFERLHNEALTRLPGVARVNSSVAIRTVQKTTQLPLPVAAKIAVDRSQHIAYSTVHGTRNATVDSARPVSPKTPSCSRCPTSARRKWHLAHITWFFERFVLRSMLTTTSASTTTFTFCSTPTTTRLARCTRGRGADCCRDRRLPKFSSIVRMSMRRCWSLLEQRDEQEMQIASLLACITSSNTRNSCSPTSSTCCRATRRTRQ